MAALQVWVNTSHASNYKSIWNTSLIEKYLSCCYNCYSSHSANYKNTITRYCSCKNYKSVEKHIDRDLIWKKETRVQVDDRCNTAAVWVFCPQMLCYIWTPCWRWRTFYVPTEPANFRFSARLTWMGIEWFNRSSSPNFIGQNVSSCDRSDHFVVVMLKIMYPLFYIASFTM